MIEALFCPRCGAPLDAAEVHPSVIHCPYCHSDLVISEPLHSAAVGNAAANTQSQAETARARQSAVLSQVAGLVRQGKKIEAIKQVRAHFEIGLKEAKDLVDQMERGEVLSLPLMKTSAPAALNTQDIQEVLVSGNKIEAIRLYRERFNVDLRSAKEAVDAMEAGLLEPAAQPRPASQPFDSPYQPDDVLPFPPRRSYRDREERRLRIHDRLARRRRAIVALFIVAMILYLILSRYNF